MASPSMTVPSPDLALAGPPMTLTTTSGSVIHYLFSRQFGFAPGNAFTPIKIYLTAAAFAFLPLFLGAMHGDPSIVTAEKPHLLPFLRDWNVLFMSLVSFPCLLILTVTDQDVLALALKTVQSDGTITISNADKDRLAERWRNYFRITNLAAQLVGLIVGGTIAYFNYVAYSPPDVGFWISDKDHLLVVGVIFLCFIFIFYAVVPIYILRNIAISLLFRDIVAHAQLHMLPMHPDKAGGLRPVGRLGLRNQYALTLLGLNIVLLVMVSRHYLHVTWSLNALMTAAVLAYLILGPVVFVAPLLPFRGGMLKSKSELLREVALRIRMELDRLRAQLPSGQITKDDEKLIARLRKIGEVIDELPVWPFDAGTGRKFLTAYAIPILSTAGYLLQKIIGNFANFHFLG
jgi:hypothetical protein